MRRWVGWTAGTAINTSGWSSIVHVVEEVEGLDDGLHLDIAIQIEVLREGSIDIDDAGTPQRITSPVAERSNRRQCIGTLGSFGLQINWIAYVGRYGTVNVTGLNDPLWMLASDARRPCSARRDHNHRWRLRH